MRLEEFRKQLIPVEYVYRVSYESPDVYHSRGVTLVYVQLPGNSYHSSIEFEGNLLKKFKEWYDSLNVQSFPPGSIFPGALQSDTPIWNPVIISEPSHTTNGPFCTQSWTGSDGVMHTTTITGESSASEEVKG